MTLNLKPRSSICLGGRVTTATYRKMGENLTPVSVGLFPDAEPQEWRWRDGWSRHSLLSGTAPRRSEGCKDANDVLVNFGEGELSRHLTIAKRMDPKGGFITGISDLPPLPDRRVLRLGMSPYDKFLAFEVGAMSVGTGTPGAGKSAFTRFAAHHVAEHEDVRVGILGFETHPYRTRDRLARLFYRKPWNELDPRQKGTFPEYADKHFRIVHRTFEDDAEHHMAWLRETIYTLAVRDNCKLIIIDPWNELEHLPERGESMTAYINFALQRIRQWAEQFDVHICLIAHPRKMPTESRPRAPTGYDIADGAAFYNKPSLGFSVHKESNNDEGTEWVTLSTWKVRDTQLYGFTPNSTKLTFHEYGMNYSRFEDNSMYRRKSEEPA